MKNTIIGSITLFMFMLFWFSVAILDSVHYEWGFITLGISTAWLGLFLYVNYVKSWK